jgi:hypothetical protein
MEVRPSHSKDMFGLKIAKVRSDVQIFNVLDFEKDFSLSESVGGLGSSICEGKLVRYDGLCFQEVVLRDLQVQVRLVCKARIQINNKFDLVSVSSFTFVFSVI